MESTNGNDTGGMIKELRGELGITQAQFARALGIAVATVNRWENGRFRPSRLAHNAILALAAQHGIELVNA